jgi:two-component system OmpR family sensor kinase
MSMRARLSLAIGAVIVVTLLLFSVVVVRDTRVALTRQVDAQVKDAAKHSDAPDGKDKGGPPPSVSTPQVNNPTGKSVGMYYYKPDGSLDHQYPGGYSDNPDSAPILPASSNDRQRIVGDIVTLPTTNDDVDCRAYVQLSADGEYKVAAASLQPVDDAVNSLKRFLFFGGGGAVVLSLGASWLIIRRGLRPVDRMVDTATAIAAGDLSSRVPNPDPHTELGQLGGALNEMLSQIEQAVEIRAASEERLRRFVADAAHELRTPLTSLRGYAELYRQGALPTQEGVTRAMGRIESEGSRMARLVEDLLLLARLDQHRPLERRQVDVSVLLNDAVNDFMVANPERTVSSQIEPALMVIGDPLRLRQVFDNLLTNTRAHTPVGTNVEVTLSRVDSRVRVVVADDGPGISPEDQARVFERFWRADPARSRNGGGTGLGLAITASLVDAQEGSIELESDVGTGTRFIIWFPHAPEPFAIDPGAPAAG